MILEILCRSVVAAPPTVLTTTPTNGSADVDPDVSDIRVEFDQDMDPKGHSWVGGGITFPRVTGPPRWLNSRVCTLPVSLQPAHQYVIAINSRSFKGFCNVNGEPAVPYRFEFRTADRRGKAVRELTAEDCTQAAYELRRAIETRYSYRDLRGIDWDLEFDRYRDRLINASSWMEFGRVAAEFLAVARDPHIWIEIGTTRIATTTRDVAPNVNLDLLPAIVPKWREHGAGVATGRYADGIAYLLIPTWEESDAEVLQAVPDLVNAFSDAPGLVLDVRPNSGGSETLAKLIASCFTRHVVTYAKHLQVAPKGYPSMDGPISRILMPAKDRKPYRGRIVVLMGPYNMSACEDFLLMMKQVSECKLVGERSYGSSGNPKPVLLSQAVTVFLPSWQDMAPDGRLLEGHGIEPDVRVPATRADFQVSDPVLTRALSILRSSSAPSSIER